MKLGLKVIALSALLVSLGVILSCTKAEVNEEANYVQTPTVAFESNSNRFDIAEFERNRELWTSKNIQNYRMIVGAESFSVNFPEEVLIEVRKRKAVSVKSLSTSGRNATSTYSEFSTVEKLFDFLDEAGNANAQKLFVKYDADLGFPFEIEVDRDGHYGNDDELLLKVRDFQVNN